MDSVSTNSVLPADISAFENSTTNRMLTMALTALRIKNPKVPHSSIDPEIRKPETNTLSEITLEEVAEHDDITNCWIVIYDRVYDVTEFLATHPAGADVILDYAGRDATVAFRGTGHSKMAISLLQNFIIGELPPNERLFRRPDSIFMLSDVPE